MSIGLAIQLCIGKILVVFRSQGSTVAAFLVAATLIGELRAQETLIAPRFANDTLVPAKEHPSEKRQHVLGIGGATRQAAAMKNSDDEYSIHPADTSDFDGPGWEIEGAPKPVPFFSESSLGNVFHGTQCRVGGSIKLDTIFDLDDAGDRFQFLPRQFPIEGAGGPTTTFHARQIFVNLAITQPTNFGDIDFFIEGDFFGEGNSFRLRHAYGRCGRILAGQTWSQLVDEDAFVETLDFAGSDSGALLRVPQLRLTLPFSDSLLVKLGIEENVADTVETGVAGQIRNRYPALATGVRLGSAANHVYAVGAIADARFVPELGPDQSETVWALGLSSRCSVGNNDSLIARAILGDGANSLVTDNSFRATGLTAPLGQFEVLREYSGSIAYQHFWREDLRSNIVYRKARADNSPIQTGSAYRSLSYFATNLIWTPVESVDVGFEVLQGQRESKDLQSENATRFQFSITWRLP